MSANILLDGTGKIAGQYLPATTPDLNPVFESVAISPPAATPGVLNIENATGDSTYIRKNADGSTEILTSIAPLSYVGALAIASDGSTIDIGGANCTNVQLVATTSITLDAETLVVGDGGPNIPTITLDGPSGNGTVYDTVYNTVGRAYVGLTASYPAADALTTAAPLSGTYTAPVTGVYAVSFVVEPNVGATLGANSLVANFEPGLGSATSWTIAPATIPYDAVAGPNPYTYNGIAYLTAGQVVAWSITGYGAGWNVPVSLSVARIS